MSAILRSAATVSALFLSVLCCFDVSGQAPLPPVSPGPQQGSQGASATPPKLLKAASGPSGKTVGDRFVFNEERKRFVIPQDKSMVVYMEWEGQPGDQKITGVWKRPDGSTGFLSSDIELVSQGPQFNAYWTFYLNSGMEPGIWQFEALVNGTPAGSYSFEIVSSIPSEPVVEAKVAAKLPTLDDLYQLRKSLVWVHQLDSTGHRLDTYSGFVVSEGVIATSFQALDVADGLEIEFSDGRKEPANEVLAFSTADDWALLKANTDTVDALGTAESPEVRVGDRLVVFNVEAQSTRVIGGVDYTGRKASGKMERFVFSPGLAGEAMGGPLLDVKGNVIGLLSGCIAPGTRLGGASRLMGGVGVRLCTRSSAVPIAAPMAGLSRNPVTFSSLKTAGVITPPVRKLDAFLHGGTRRPVDAQAQKRRLGRLSLDDEAEFNRADGSVAVYSWWQQPEHVKKQPPLTVSATVYDSENRPRVNVEPTKVKLSKGVPTEHVFSFPTSALGPGIFRIDTLADGVCVWRTFVLIRE